jgi:hypothetical protein
MTTYSKIRAIRNKHFPPKLELGCEIEANNPNLICDIHIYCGIDIYSVDNYIARLQNADCVSMSLEDLKKGKFGIKNLGKPVSLNDVLLSSNIPICTAIVGNELRFFHSFSDIEIEDYFLSIDVSKPIKDHDEKTLLQIYELIK